MGNSQSSSSSSSSIVYASDFKTKDFVKVIKEDAALLKLFSNYLTNFEETCVNGEELVLYNEKDIISLCKSCSGDGEIEWSSNCQRKAKSMMEVFINKYKVILSSNSVTENMLSSIGSNKSFSITKDDCIEKDFIENNMDDVEDDVSEKEQYYISKKKKLTIVYDNDLFLNPSKSVLNLNVDFFPIKNDNNELYWKISIQNNSNMQFFGYISNNECNVSIITSFPVIKKQDSTNIFLGSDFTDM